MEILKQEKIVSQSLLLLLLLLCCFAVPLLSFLLSCLMLKLTVGKYVCEIRLKPKEGWANVEGLGVTPAPVPHRVRHQCPFKIRALLQEHNIRSVRSLLSLAVIVVGVRVGARPPEKLLRRMNQQ